MWVMSKSTALITLRVWRKVERNCMPLPEVCYSLTRPVCQREEDTGLGKRAAGSGHCQCSFAGNSEPEVPEDAGSQAGALPTGALVLFNSRNSWRAHS